MDCLLEGNSVKAFGKAVQALARVGDELWFDPMVRGLALRAVNSAHSGYACFLFTPMFFQRYSLGPASEQSSGPIKCKLVMKSVLPLFRCLTSIERNVERCQIIIGTSNDRVTIQFFCRHGITKTHNLHYQEREALHAVFASHLCPNVLKASARLLGDMVMHFPVSQDEITLSTTPLRVSLRNYCEEGNDHVKVTSTEMSLHPDEFDYFGVGVDSDITFCLKEFRGLLSFAESHDLPVSVHFGAAGEPVCFSVNDVVLEATVLLATLTNPEGGSPSRAAEAPPTPATRCADAAARPAAPCEEDSGEPQGAAAATEVMPSSRGSPANVAPARMPQPRDSQRAGEAEEAPAGAPATPASSSICSLLFRALSSEEASGHAPTLPILARFSDEEENMEEYYVQSPSL